MSFQESYGSLRLFPSLFNWVGFLFASGRPSIFTTNLLRNSFNNIVGERLILEYYHMSLAAITQTKRRRSFENSQGINSLSVRPWVSGYKGNMKITSTNANNTQ